MSEDYIETATSHRQFGKARESRVGTVAITKCAFASLDIGVIKIVSTRGLMKGFEVRKLLSAAYHAPPTGSFSDPDHWPFNRELSVRLHGSFPFKKIR